MQSEIPKAPKLREALAWARTFGLVVRPVNRTGEILIRDPGNGRHVRVNARRKDASRKLVLMLRRAQEGSTHGKE